MDNKMDKVADILGVQLDEIFVRFLQCFPTSISGEELLDILNNLCYNYAQEVI